MILFTHPQPLALTLLPGTAPTHLWYPLIEYFELWHQYVNWLCYVNVAEMTSKNDLLERICSTLYIIFPTLPQFTVSVISTKGPSKSLHYL